MLLTPGEFILLVRPFIGKRLVEVQQKDGKRIEGRLGTLKGYRAYRSETVYSLEDEKGEHKEVHLNNRFEIQVRTGDNTGWSANWSTDYNYEVEEVEGKITITLRLPDQKDCIEYVFFK